MLVSFRQRLAGMDAFTDEIRRSIHVFLALSFCLSSA